MLKISAVFAVLAAPAFASCPDPSRQEQARHSVTGAQLLAPQTYDTVAGGAHAFPCPEFIEADRSLARAELAGFMGVRPDAVFELAGMAPHILTVSARAECGPVLMVLAPDGQWLFGDSAPDGPVVTLWSVPDGPLRVWLGSSTAAGCEGTFTLETFDH